MITTIFNSGSLLGSWDQCNAYCSTSYPGAMMLCVNNAAEDDWLTGQYAQLEGLKNYWIGYTDMPPYGGGKGTKQYGWITGCSSTYTNWASGQPNNEYDREDYAHVDFYTDPSSQWVDHPQTDYHYFQRCGCQYKPDTSGDVSE